MIKEQEVDEEIYIFEQDDIKLKVTKNHIIPVIRNNERIELKAHEILESDLLITNI